MTENANLFILPRPRCTQQTILQSIGELRQHYPKQTAQILAGRTPGHKYKNNNYLKMHRQPMRRKPFKRQRPLLDEFGSLGAPMAPIR